MKANIIYDFRLTDRYEPLMAELKRQKIIFRLWTPVFDPNSVIRSINLSHKQIVRWAQEIDLPEVLIMEDDVFFPAEDGFKRFIEGIPPMPFDIYLGGTYGLNRPITGLTNKVNGLHCYIIRQRFYDTFLGLPEDKHIDVAMDGLGIYYVEYPFVALQRPGFSSNSRAYSDKNADLNKEDIYYGNI